MIRIFIISIILLTSCNDKKLLTPSTEVLEVYGTVEDTDGYRKGDLMHYESKNFKDSKHIETIYYNGQGEAKGREIFIYKNDNDPPSKSEYRDPENNLLSYYQLEYNREEQKIKSLGYDGKNGELLRIEAFDYKDGNRTKKEIRNSADELQQVFVFNFDEFGNETEMIVLNGNNDTIAVETYQITQRDEKNKWLEKWGFLNDKPSTYQILKK